VNACGFTTSKVAVVVSLLLQGHTRGRMVVADTPRTNVTVLAGDLVVPPSSFPFPPSKPELCTHYKSQTKDKLQGRNLPGDNRC